MTKILLVILVIFTNGIGAGHVVTAPSMADCRAAEPAIVRQYRDAPEIPGWHVKDVRSICLEFA
jgi:hypothetical protein